MENIIWSRANVIIIEYNCDNSLNTWIPIKWIALDNNLYEEERKLDSLQQLDYSATTNYNPTNQLQNQK